MIARRALGGFFEGIGAANGLDDFFFFMLGDIAIAVFAVGVFVMRVYGVVRLGYRFTGRQGVQVFAMRFVIMGFVVMAVIVVRMRFIVMRVIVEMSFVFGMLAWRQCFAGMIESGLLGSSLVGLRFGHCDVIGQGVVGGRIRRLTFYGSAAHALLVAVMIASAAARTATAATGASTATGAGFMLGFRSTVRAFVFGDQRLTVGDRDLIIVGMDFAEGEKAVAVAAVIDERRLKRRFDAGYLGEIDIAADLAAVRGFKVEFLDPVTT